MGNRKCCLMASVIFVLMFTACQSSEEKDILYNQSGVCVSVIDDETNIESEKYVSNAIWVEITDELVYEEQDLIITGVVSNIREVTIEYSYGDADITDYGMIVDVTISNILYAPEQSKLSINDTISVGISYNSHRRLNGYPIVSEGSSFMMFCKESSNIEYNEILQRDKYTDYWCSAPNYLLIEKVGDYYLGNEFFSKYTKEFSELESEETLETSKVEDFDKARTTLYQRMDAEDEDIGSQYYMYNGKEFEKSISDTAVIMKGGN